MKRPPADFRSNFEVSVVHCLEPLSAHRKDRGVTCCGVIDILTLFASIQDDHVNWSLLISSFHFKPESKSKVKINILLFVYMAHSQNPPTTFFSPPDNTCVCVMNMRAMYPTFALACKYWAQDNFSDGCRPPSRPSWLITAWLYWRMTWLRDTSWRKYPGVTTSSYLIRWL